MRLIDADAAKRKIIEEIVVHLPKFNPAGFAIITAVAKMFDCEDDFPTVDAEPVRHAEWIYGEYDIPHCSECGKEPKEISPFCPQCGAKMDGGDSS